MDDEELLGVFPTGNPIPYTGRVEAFGLQNTPWVRTWYHATWKERVGGIARLGLLPSCWFGGDCCCVFGFDSLGTADIEKDDSWIIELRSRIQPYTDLKAWWVRPNCVVGAWHAGCFYPRDILASLSGINISAKLGNVACSDKLCAEQFKRWQDLALLL